MRAPTFACAAKVQAEESGFALKWLLPSSAEPVAAAGGPAPGTDSQGASLGLREKSSAELADTAAAAAASTTENADIGTAAGRRQGRGALGVHRIGLRGRGCRHGLLRSVASGRPGCRFDPSGCSQSCGS